MFNHHQFFALGDQTVHVTVTASGTNLLILGLGGGMILLGGGLAVGAIAKRRASRRAPRGPPRAGGQLLYKPRTPP